MSTSTNYKILTLFFVTFLTIETHASCNPSEAKGSNNAKEQIAYGLPNLTGESIDLAFAIKKFDQYVDQAVKLKASVTNVCHTKGCWITLAPEGSDIRVRFKDYGFFVPISLIGKEVIVHGTLVREQVSKKLYQHYLEDARADQEIIDAVQGPVYEYTIIAQGVEVL